MIDPTPSPDTTPSPVRPASRIELVDVLRGFAVFGILFANMASFQGRSIDPNAWAEPLDRVLVIAHRFLVEAKFYSLFSFLFGWGAALQWRRATARGAGFPATYLRRMLILLGIGLAHAFLIWRGDILAHYALFGLLLLLFRRRSPRLLLVVAAACLLLSVVLTLPGEGLDAVRDAYARLTEPLRAGDLPEGVYASGSYAQITRLRIQDYLEGSSWMLYYFGNVFAMFLLGLYAGRRELFSRAEANLPAFKKLLVAGLALGLPLNGLFAWTLVHPDWPPPAAFRLLTTGARTLGAPALTLAYIAVFALLSRRKAWQARLAPLAPVGRMALTNYLTHSVLGTLIFYGYGLGLYGSTDPTFGLILTVVIFLAQIRFSAWWLARYQYGPLEWLWRSLTYGRLQPLARDETRPQPPPAKRSALRRWLGGLHPLVPLAVVWTALLIWAAVLWGWHQRLEASSAPDLVQVVVRVTATPDSGRSATSESGSTSAGSFPSGTLGEMPALNPVDYRPGPLAASGEMGALARAFDPAAALAQIEALADPSFEGRYAGSPGGQAAADYIASQFERYRLQPAGDDGNYFQPFPVTYTPLAAPPQLSVSGPGGRAAGEFTLFQDYAPLVRMYAGAGQGSGQVVWADHCQPEDFAGLETVGRVVFCEAGSSGQAPHQAGRAALEHGAAGLLLLTDPDVRPTGFGDIYAETWVPETLPAYRVYPPVADRLLAGTGMTVEDLWGGVDPFPLLTGVDMSVSLAEACPVSGCLGRNVLGVLPGRDPAHAGEVVIIGAHYDHLGAGPEGTLWAGANDNASGVAVLLEIARLWAQEGYVPRRTVVFAAWDAEEAGLIGSRHYVAQPALPLANTVAVLALDMVGAGDETLKIDGADGLAGRLLAAAEDLDVPAARLGLGRSDHVPFLEEGVPAALLIWWDEEGQIPHYHRPQDVPAVIEPDKLAAAGRLAAAALLDLAESEPALQDLLVRRAGALNESDLEAFLETGTPEQSVADGAWFRDLKEHFPGEVSLGATNLRIQDDRATALLHIEVEPPEPQAEDASPTTSVDLPALFRRDAGIWRYAGPDLAEAALEPPPEEGPAPLPVAHAPGLEDDWAALSQEAAQQYAGLAGLLGLPAEGAGTLELFARPGDLKAATALSLPDEQAVWAEPGVLKLVHTTEISQSRQLRDGLAQLLLAANGVERGAAPWLWEGLPLILEARLDPVGVQRRWLPELQAALAGSETRQGPALSWAATGLLQDTLGWEGLGGFIAYLGERCRSGACGAGEGLEEALLAHVGRDTAGFDGWWQQSWQARLRQIQAGLDAAAGARASAVRAGDQAAFLASVDPAVPHLLAEERAWFESLAGSPLDEYSLQAAPLAVLADGRVLARVSLFERSPGGQERHYEFDGVFTTQEGGGYRWAGPLFEAVQAEGVTVRYQTRGAAAAPAADAAPLAEAALAQELLTLVLELETPIEDTLGLETEAALTLSLFQDTQAFQASIAPGFPDLDWAGAWYTPGGSLKLRLNAAGGAGQARSALVVHLIRRLLAENGVRAEWLLKGLSLYLARPYDGGAASAEAAAALPLLQDLAARGGLQALPSLPPDHNLTRERAAVIQAQAWDSVRYLVETEGWPVVQRLVGEQRAGSDLEGAFHRAVGLDLGTFQSRWESSLLGGHLDPAWLEVAAGFDQAQAMQHVEALSAPELAGRPAGEAGERAAAAYLAEQFAAYGLQPAGGDPGQPFLQTFVISSTNPIAPPRLEFWFPDAGGLLALRHRDDFVALQPAPPFSGPVTGELIWVNDLGAEGLALEGKIVVRRSGSSAEEDARLAAEQGAVGLILVGTRREPEEMLGKLPWITLPQAQGGIPVLELTRQGYTRFLEAGGLDSGMLISLQGAEALGGVGHVDFRLQAPQQAESANVLGLLPGADPFLAREVIVLGAHYDHVGDDPAGLACPWRVDGVPVSESCRRIPGRRYGGANDDASGVAVLLEVARLWQQAGYRPARSVLFAAWGAQEPGQLGSAHYLAEPMLPLSSTLGMVQLDGIGGGEGFNLGVQGEWELDGLPFFLFSASAEALEEKVTPAGHLTPGDHWGFREAGLPTLLVQWRLASEANLPDGIANAVHPDRLKAAGRVAALALMALAH